MSNAHQDATALLRSAQRGDLSATTRAAAAAMRGRDAAEVQQLVAKLAWVAGCFARRLPPELAMQITRDLDHAPALAAGLLRREAPSCH